jgi:hypothetical protein
VREASAIRRLGIGGIHAALRISSKKLKKLKIFIDIGRKVSLY